MPTPVQRGGHLLRMAMPGHIVVRQDVGPFDADHRLQLLAVLSSHCPAPPMLQVAGRWCDHSVSQSFSPSGMNTSGVWSTQPVERVGDESHAVEIPDPVTAPIRPPSAEVLSA